MLLFIISVCLAFGAGVILTKLTSNPVIHTKSGKIEL